MPETDGLLIHKTIQGDTGSFGKLVECHQHHIFNLALKMAGNPEDAGDITQETFIKAFNSLASFRYECGFKTWLYRIASNTCLDHLRRRSRDSVRIVEKPPGPGPDMVENIPASAWSNPEEKVVRGERAAAVRKALNSLPETYRLPLIMQHYHEMSYREISEALDIPEKTVATRLYRAKNALKEMLMGGEYGEVLTGEKKAGRHSGRRVHAL